MIMVPLGFWGRFYLYSDLVFTDLKRLFRKLDRVSSRYEYPTKLSVRPNAQQGAIIETVLKRALYGRKRNPIGAPRRYSLQGSIH
ncbi:MAG: hypothetical protein KatS3mg017_0336 [Fimbriimonadales bacterium]|nr:MAG: hypothetical protein KatS3mg017_0336 [Fimbriimonadales bacterium]